jgi:catechol 2,3-dioxygenase-like lactoylglutathione lyase family enzyme
MRVLPIRYCADVEASIRFYRTLGLELGSATRPGSWVELPAAAGILALHKSAEHPGVCELAFEADEPLETVAARLAEAGYPADAIVDESFGRSLRVRDPDGVYVQVNENDRTLYT